MEDDAMRIRTLLNEGNCCSRAIVKLGLEAAGKDNPLLVQAVGALCGGIKSGLTCGALSGAACMICALADGPDTDDMVRELVEWFDSTYTELYGGVDCDTIVDGEPANKKLRCPIIIEDTYIQAKSILCDYGYEF